MRILIFGAGAIGSLFGGFLSQKYDVTLIGRKKHMNKIKRDGLRITGKTKGIFYPKTETKILEKYDLIILTTKAYDTKKSMEILKPIIDSNIIILSLQNGLGNEEIIMNSIGLSKGCDGKRLWRFPSISGKVADFSRRNKGVLKDVMSHGSRGNTGVLRGITNHGVVFIKSGEIRHSGTGETVVGEIDGTITDRIKKICSMFNDAGIKTRISNDIKNEVWAKTIVNSAINPITAVTGLKNGYLLKIPELTKVMEKVCEEGIRVANKSGIFFDFNVFEKTKKIAALTSENRSSMLQDLQNKKKTEIDFINGAIVKIGKRHGIETPLNSMLTVLVKGIENILSTG